MQFYQVQPGCLILSFVPKQPTIHLHNVKVKTDLHIFLIYLENRNTAFTFMFSHFAVLCLEFLLIPAEMFLHLK